MPGKVNPVIPEVVNQVAFLVIGHDLTVTLAPKAASCSSTPSSRRSATASCSRCECSTPRLDTLTKRCVVGIEADVRALPQRWSNSIVLVTALNPVLGYEAAAAIAKRALATGRTIADVALESGGLTREQLDSR